MPKHPCWVLQALPIGLNIYTLAFCSGWFSGFSVFSKKPVEHSVSDQINLNNANLQHKTAGINK